MSDSSFLPKSCPKCGAELPSEATEGLCPRCLMAEAMQPTGPKTPAGRWEPPTAEDLQKLLPQYEITALLGRGGMGAVYKGTQKSLDRPVAIKILSNQLDAADASFAERFKNEARSMAKLKHPGIVGVYDFGETPDGMLYIVMEFIEGTDVAKMISKKGRLHTDHAMAITAHVCDALAYAHERGIIHRDIKPANIMVGYDGVVKVADFGLAKMSHDNRSGLTQSGMAMGTLHYMAPEALMLGSSVDQRADIYAVGVMLYQMLTGKLPQGLFEMPSLQVKGLDPRYDGIISKALREDREVRYSNALAMRLDLDAILTQPVVKVDAAAEKAPAALPTQARPQRPAGQPYRPPPPQVIVQPPKKGSPLLWGALLAMTLAAAWFYFKGTFVIKVDPSDGGSQVNVTSSAEKSAPTALILSDITKDAPFVNSLGMKFVPVLGTDLLFCIHEVRRKDYAVYASAVADVDVSWKTGSSQGVPAAEVADCPVVRVSWNDATAFCDWLSRKEGRTYRLPSRQEWSRAVGIGDLENLKSPTPAQTAELENHLPFASGWPPSASAGNYGTIDGKAVDAFPQTAPVMRFAANALGIFDLGGNVWEWCEGPHPHYPNERALRGGCWNNNKYGDITSKMLNRNPPDARNDIYGFRCVLKNAPPVQTITQLPTAPQPVVPRAPAPPPVPLGPTTTTWTDNRGRVITAKFNAIQGDNVMLEIAGKEHTLPLSTLSAESQKLAQNLAQQAMASSSITALTKATKDAPFTNSLGMKFVPVPGTRVLMCIHETRKGDYAMFASQKNGVDPSWKNQWREGTRISPTDDHPVVMVLWEEARAFCAWLSQKEGKNYRLPTDREWSFAVGIGTQESASALPVELHRQTQIYPWGMQWPPPANAGNYADISAHFTNQPIIERYDDNNPTTAPVMSFPANALGLYDLGGNVWEWCEDWFDSRQQERVLRGSAWNRYVQRDLLSSFRNHDSPLLRTTVTGFRCVIEIAAANTLSAAATSAAPVPPASKLRLPRTAADIYDTKRHALGVAAFDAFVLKHQPPGSPQLPQCSVIALPLRRLP